MFKFTPYLVIIVLGVIIFIQHGCNKNNSITPKSIHDTIIKDSIIHIHDTIRTKPIIIKSISDSTWDSIPVYIPDTNYNKLKKQYEVLGNLFFTKNIYNTPIKLDTFGLGTIVDTIQNNKLIGQSFKYSFNIPIKTITINNTVYPKSKDQVYIGGDLIGNPTNILSGVGLGLIYKTKTDKIYKLGVEQSFNGITNYTVGTYFKIKL